MHFHAGFRLCSALAEELGEKSVEELVLEGQELAETILLPVRASDWSDAWLLLGNSWVHSHPHRLHVTSSNSQVSFACEAHMQSPRSIYRLAHHSGQRHEHNHAAATARVGHNAAVAQSIPNRLLHCRRLTPSMALLRWPTLLPIRPASLRCRRPSRALGQTTSPAHLSRGC